MKKSIAVVIAVFAFFIVEAQFAQAEFNRIYELNLGNNPQVADDAIKKAEIKFPNEAGVKFLRGMYQYKEGDENNAMRSYTDAIKADPKFHESYLQRAYIFEKKGLFDKAREDVTTYIKINSNNYQGYKLRSGLNYRSENYQSALEDFKSLIIIKPTSVVDYMDLAFTYVQLNQLQNGKNVLNNAYAVPGIDIDMLNIVYGQFLLKQKDFEKAKQKYNLAYIQAENKFEADDFSNFSVCAYKSRELDNAIIYVLKAIKLAPEDIEDRCNLAAYYKDKENWNKVIEIAQAALNINNNHPLANMLMGMGLFKTGKESEGKIYLEKALRLEKEQKN